MMKLIRIVALFLACNITVANAFMPTYPDDDEFVKCNSIMPNPTLCQREQQQRILNRVKKQYQYILSTPASLGWNGSVEENVKVIRDMYESWSAFRNRLCSISKIATKYVEPLYNEEYSCNSYYMLHLEDHLISIYQLLTDSAPKNRDDFKFLHIYDHDEDYDACMTDKNKNKEMCIDEEITRSTQVIKNIYKTMSEDEFLGKWNNSENLKTGNYRDMFDSWIAYRNRICSLAVWSYQRYYGPQSIRINDCIQFYNREKLETMFNLLSVAHSAIDAVEFTTDGGLAEGQTIKPLKKHIDVGKGNEEEDLTVIVPLPKPKDASEKEPISKADAQKKQADDALKNQQIPSWAKH